MRKLLLYISLLALPTGLFADNDTQHLQEQLDLLLSHQTAHIKRKNETINRIKKGLLTEEKTLKRLQTYDLLYQEYYVFQFDSAMTYLDKGIDLAKETANTYYYNSNVIHKAELLSIGGLYNEAIETISLVDTTALDRTQKFDFYLSLFRIHTYWADFCNDHTYTPAHREKAKQALIKAMDYCDETAKTYEYYYGEYCVFVLNDPKKARLHYLKAIRQLPSHLRFLPWHALPCLVTTPMKGERISKKSISYCPVSLMQRTARWRITPYKRLPCTSLSMIKTELIEHRSIFRSHLKMLVSITTDYVL